MTVEPTFMARRARGRMAALLVFIALGSGFLLLLDFDWFRNLLFDTPQTRFWVRLEWTSRVVGVLGFGTVLLKLPSLAKSPVELAINAEGIRFTPFSDALLPWSRITRIAERRMNVQRVLSIWIADAESFPIKGFYRRLTSLNRKSGDFGDLNIDALRLDRTIAEIRDAVAHFHRIED